MDSKVKRYLERLYLYRCLIYVDGLVFFLASVSLFRTDEFDSTYNVSSTPCANAVKPGFY